MKIRKLPAEQSRVETGPVQFGDDWPGLFIRGDNAIHYAMHLRNVLDHYQPNDGADAIVWSILRGLVDDLRSCQV